MPFNWFRPDPFARALKTYGLHHCTMAGETLCIGLSPNPAYRLLPLAKPPSVMRAVSFLDAPVQADLIRAFVISTAAQSVERLAIGTSQDNAKKRRIGDDMRAAIAALSGAQFPRLTVLSLGDMEMLSNGHRLFGTLGEIGPTFASAPKLSELHLHGHFTLAAKLRHTALQLLVVEAQDIAASSAALDPHTVANLLLSDFPALRQADLSLSLDPPEPSYTLPEALFSQTHLPALQALEITGLTPEAQEKLDSWKAQRGVQ